ncbi:Metallo-hydrolase/oxidoreductase [Piromyces finnis]|uniref:Endoribonuclease YSH1 n=1 Tax=Piromyces finnis TaxID=1754191 RepID=A0A1Y1V7G4_9FUNG|nr:Metallo-hydrolase/oxidoreductase [Piromyces finnis]|eukprot:ORX48407.1 Metallo-hydrolase/oxidoreductase [Piromyces finnis]
MGVKRKAIEIEVPGSGNQTDMLKITPLGAGNEVGRSCILLEYKGKTIMLDCGIHPAYTGLSSLPFFDEIDPSEIDIVLITHFHLDHAASLPYFLEKTTFKGRVFMTHPTKAIYKWLISDYMRVSNVVVDDILYDEKDIINSCEKIETIDYHQEVEVEGIKFTGYNAGHVIGAAMFLIEIASVKLLYTGDYSREEDRHLMAAEKPNNLYTDIMICESTYGVQSLESRLEREARFTKIIKEIVQRGGRCLIPVFALGRAQEILLILDEFWQENLELHSIPIYYASSLAKKCMAIYQTYINMMNAKIRKQYKISNPFVFKHISYLKNMEHFDDVGPCVMMASPGMLQNGLSRELLEMWCIDKRNGLVIPGYVVEGTMGKTILSEPDEIVSVTGAKLPRKLSVHYISFSAHVDYTQNSRFIELINPSHLILVHGDSNEMGRLRSALQSKYAEKEHPMQIYTPKNCETIELYFKGKKQAKMAKVEPKNNDRLSGVLVSKDFHYHIMDAKELSEFTDVNTTEIIQKQKLSFHGTFSLVIFHLEQMFGEIKIIDNESILVFNTVTVKSIGKSQLQIEWRSDNTGDMIADSVLAVLLQIEGSPASVRSKILIYNSFNNFK